MCLWCPEVELRFMLAESNPGAMVFALELKRLGTGRLHSPEAALRAGCLAINQLTFEHCLSIRFGSYRRTFFDTLCCGRGLDS